MQIPPFEGNEAPLYATGLIAFTVALWKSFFKFRHDKRIDGEATEESAGKITSLAGLRAEVVQLRTDMSEQSRALDEEARKRRRAEDSTHRLRMYVGTLAAEIRRIGGTVPAMPDPADETIGDSD